MILLDTNVISELMRAEPARIVLDWFGNHEAGDLFISAVTEAELRTGVAILPEGQRRDRLQLAIDAMIDQDFQLRVLPFDSLAAKAYAEILDLKFAYASNGAGIVEFDFLTGLERELVAFPPPQELWARLHAQSGLSQDQSGFGGTSPNSTRQGSTRLSKQKPWSSWLSWIRLAAQT